MINIHDIDYMKDRLYWNAERNRIKLIGLLVIDRFIHLTNDVSDGWSYWSIPRRAAEKLDNLITQDEDATEADLKKALTPIKSCITRHKKDFERSHLLQPFLQLLSDPFSKPSQPRRIEWIPQELGDDEYAILDGTTGQAIVSGGMSKENAELACKCVNARQ